MPHIELSLSAHDRNDDGATCQEWAVPVRGSSDACRSRSRTVGIRSVCARCNCQKW